MIITQKILQEVEQISDVICNKCGASCKGNLGNFNGLIEAKVYGAYDSTHLADGGVYCFSLCEKCLSELMDTFQHKSGYGNSLLPENWGDD